MVRCVVNRYKCRCSDDKWPAHCPAAKSQVSLDAYFASMDIGTSAPPHTYDLVKHLQHERRRAEKKYIFFVFKRYTEEELADPKLKEETKERRVAANQEYFAVLRTLQQLDLVRDIAGYVAAVENNVTFGLCGCHLSREALTERTTKAGKVFFEIRKVAGLNQALAFRMYLSPNQLRDAFTPQTQERPRWGDRFELAPLEVKLRDERDYFEGRYIAQTASLDEHKLRADRLEEQLRESQNERDDYRRKAENAVAERERVAEALELLSARYVHAGDAPGQAAPPAPAPQRNPATTSERGQRGGIHPHRQILAARPRMQHSPFPRDPTGRPRMPAPGAPQYYHGDVPGDDSLVQQRQQEAVLLARLERLRQVAPDPPPTQARSNKRKADDITDPGR